MLDKDLDATNTERFEASWSPRGREGNPTVEVSRDGLRRAGVENYVLEISTLLNEDLAHEAQPAGQPVEGDQRAPDNGDPRRPRTQTVSAAAVVLPGEPADSTPTWQPGKTRRLCALQRIRPSSRKPWRTRVWNVRWTSPIPQRSPPRWRRCTPCWLTRDEAVERERDHSLQGLRRQRPHALVLHVRCPGVLPPRRRPVLGLPEHGSG